jgi:hypothetical protein
VSTQRSKQAVVDPGVHGVHAGAAGPVADGAAGGAAAGAPTRAVRIDAPVVAHPRH